MYHWNYLKYFFASFGTVTPFACLVFILRWILLAKRRHHQKQSSKNISFWSISCLFFLFFFFLEQPHSTMLFLVVLFCVIFVSKYVSRLAMNLSFDSASLMSIQRRVVYDLSCRISMIYRNFRPWGFNPSIMMNGAGWSWRGLLLKLDIMMVLAYVQVLADQKLACLATSDANDLLRPKFQGKKTRDNVTFWLT